MKIRDRITSFRREKAAMPDEPTGADPLRYVFIERARCPACGSADLQTIRSKNQGDGTVERRTQCRGCFYKFVVVVE